MDEWFPSNSKELSNLLDQFLNKKNKLKIEIHGLIVPHAGYAYSGEIAGKAFSLLKDKKFKRVIILGPSHYNAFRGLALLNNIKTPLGNVDVLNLDFIHLKLDYEHSVLNQIPFLQRIGINKIIPIVVGDISMDEAEFFAKQIGKLLDKETILIISSDLSHFFPYNKAESIDKETIKIIESLDLKKQKEIDACGKFPLLIAFNLCNKKGWKPKLIEYKNSGDVTGDKSGVVGYASFVF
jgi:AmmeMemoRadiSam system protein B